MLRLDNGLLKLGIDPVNGAAVSGIEARVAGEWQPVCVASPSYALSGRAADSALFAMLPFANRARNNRLSLADRQWHLQPQSGESLALHGSGWLRPWLVSSETEQSCCLKLLVDDGFPFAFDAELRIELDYRSVWLTIEITNRSDTAIPVGMGFHPYFPREEGTTLEFKAQRKWHEGADYLPTGYSVLAPGEAYSRGALLPAGWQNTCFTGWNGFARIIQPELCHIVEINGSAGLPALMVYSAPDLDRFAVEPQSHLSGCTSDTEHGLRRIDPGKCWSEHMSLRVEDIGQ